MAYSMNEMTLFINPLSDLISPAAIATKMTDQALADRHDTKAAENKSLRRQYLTLFGDKLFFEVSHSSKQSQVLIFFSKKVSK
jgi:hypothetical protein